MSTVLSPEQIARRDEYIKYVKELLSKSWANNWNNEKILADRAIKRIGSGQKYNFLMDDILGKTITAEIINNYGLSPVTVNQFLYNTRKSYHAKKDIELINQAIKTLKPIMQEYLRKRL